MSGTKIEGPAGADAASCERVLRSLPRWFGIESALLGYVRNTERLPTFVLSSDGTARGFITLEQHFPQAWEIHCLAVEAGCRRRGFGVSLVAHAEDWLRGRGARWLQVKTLADSAPSPEYAETRAFYDRVGFAALQEFPTLWPPENPCLMMIKAL